MIAWFLTGVGAYRWLSAAMQWECSPVHMWWPCKPFYFALSGKLSGSQAQAPRRRRISADERIIRIMYMTSWNCFTNAEWSQVHEHRMVREWLAGFASAR